MDGDVFGRLYGAGWRLVVQALLDGLSVDEVAERIRRHLARHLRRHGGLADAILQRQLRSQRVTGPPSNDDFHAALEALVWERALGRALPEVVGRSFDTLTDAESHMAACIQASDLEYFAGALGRRPDGRVRCRPRLRPAQSDLLDEAAPPGSEA